MEQIVNILPGLIGLDPVTLYTLLGVLVTVCNLLGRFIPDSATGPLGVARKIAKVIGLYVGNRITPTVSANDVSRAVAASVCDGTIKDAAAGLPDAVKTGVAAGNLAADILQSGSASVRFPSEAPDGSRVPDEYRTDPFRKGAAAGFNEPTKGR